MKILGKDRLASYRLWLGICMFLLLLPVAVVRAEHAGKVQILLLGDSTTEGKIPRVVKPEGLHLEQMLEQLLATDPRLPACQVVNSGVSGEYIQRLFTSGRYDRDVAKLPGLDYIFIRYGLNDRGRRENFPENFPQDFSQLIARLKQDHPQALIIPTTVIPYFNEADSEQVNQLIRQVAEQEKLPLFDIYPGYAEALKQQGQNSLNYRRFPVSKIPEPYRSLAQPYVKDGMVVVLDNELDSLFGNLPGWYGDRHPNLAGYNTIAVETAQYLTDLLLKTKEK